MSCCDLANFNKQKKAPGFYEENVTLLIPMYEREKLQKDTGKRGGKMIRRMRISAAILFAISGLLLAADETARKTAVTKTESMDFPSGGTLRLTNSSGELTVEGWDQPTLEITTVTSVKLNAGPKELETAARDLENVRITTERHGGEVVIATFFPRRRGWLAVPSLPGATLFNLEYGIKVPRSAKLIVAHSNGEVHIENIAGDIQAAVRRGAITLYLPEQGPYAIDAKSKLGSIVSDYPGTAKRERWLVGHEFVQNAPAAPRKLFLRLPLKLNALNRLKILK